MTEKVRLSTWCQIMTAVATAVLLAAIYFVREQWITWLIAAVFAGMVVMALFYMPLLIQVEEGCLRIVRPLKIKSIPLDEIASAEVLSPTMAEIRLCGSGGWFGYYGWFREPSIGKYFAYYGKASDCFLVTLKSGRKYLLGCENREEMVAFINAHR